MYTFRPLTMKDLNTISTWRYNGFMKTIFMKPYFDNYDSNSQMTKGPGGCDGYAVFKNDILFGLFEYYISDEIEIGLAINPNFIGKELSKEFILEGIDYYIENYDKNINKIKLSVEIGNDSAYHSYLKAGFVEYSRNTDEIFMEYIISK